MFESNVYSIYDRVAKNFSQPCIFSSDEVAERSFGDMISSPHYVAHKSDYELHKIGTFDHKTGCLVPVGERPVFVCSGASFAEVSADV